MLKPALLELIFFCFFY